jgi:hypothetical protein
MLNSHWQLATCVPREICVDPCDRPDHRKHIISGSLGGESRPKPVGESIDCWRRRAVLSVAMVQDRTGRHL